MTSNMISWAQIDLVKKVDVKLRPPTDVFVKTIYLIMDGLGVHIGALEPTWIQAN